MPTLTHWPYNDRTTIVPAIGQHDRQDQDSAHAFVISHLRLASQRVLADRDAFRLAPQALEAWEEINSRPARSLHGLRQLLNRPSPFRE